MNQFNDFELGRLYERMHKLLNSGLIYSASLKIIGVMEEFEDINFPEYEILYTPDSVELSFYEKGSILFYIVKHYKYFEIIGIDYKKGR